MLFFEEFIDVTGLHDSDSIFFSVIVFLSLMDEVDSFSTLKLKEELVTRVRKVEIQIDSSRDSLTSKVGRLVSLAIDLTITSSFLESSSL
jgi:tRNA(Ser,Leu) C12 N-acetylase TAN1